LGFKALFNKNIECADKLKNNLIYLYPKRTIFVGKTVLVPNDSVAVFVFKDRVSDVLNAGKFILNEATLPETFSRINSGIFGKKKGYRTVKKFNADIYFVSLEEKHYFEFFSDIPFVFKTKNFGKVKGYSMGMCTLKMFKPDLLVEKLLDIYAYLKKGILEKETGFIIGNVVNKILERINIDFTNILIHTEEVGNYIDGEIEYAFDNLGFRVTNVDVESMSFNKKQQLQINEYLAKSKLTNKEFEIENLEINKEVLKYQKESKEKNDIGGNESTELSFALNNTTRCKYCGAEAGDIFKYCPICGKVLKDE